MKMMHSLRRTAYWLFTLSATLTAPRRFARWRVGYSKSMVVASQRHLGVFGPPVVALDDPGDDPGLSGCLPGKILRRFSHRCYSVGVLSLSMF